jgi:hypothetical protein
MTVPIRGEIVARQQDGTTALPRSRDAELAEDVGQVALDGTGGDEQRLADLLVGVLEARKCQRLKR